MRLIKRCLIVLTTVAMCAWPLTSLAYVLPPSALSDLVSQSPSTYAGATAPPLTEMISTDNTRTQTASYTVQPGDTLSHIAQSFHMSVSSIVEANHLGEPDLIHAGDQLIVPSDVPHPQTTVGTQVLLCTLTAYTSGPESTGKLPGEIDYGVTSTGVQVKQGETIAVDPTVIPYGSHVFIEGVGYRIAEDTGGAIKGNRIDVYVNQLQTALDFGVKKDVKVYVLPPRPPYLDSVSAW